MNTHTVTITSPDIWKRAQVNAAKAGLSIDEYISRIVQQYVAREDKDPWGPVPKAVSQRWNREIAAFEAEDKQHPYPRFTTAQETIDYMRSQP